LKALTDDRRLYMSRRKPNSLRVRLKDPCSGVRATSRRLYLGLRSSLVGMVGLFTFLPGLGTPATIDSLSAQGISDTPQVLWDLGELTQLIISLITLYLLIWFNKVSRVKDREEVLWHRLRGVGLAPPTFVTKLGGFTPFLVRMEELKGFRYRLKKLFLWKLEGYSRIYMSFYDAGRTTDEQLYKFKELVERELGVRVSFFRAKDIRAKDILTMVLEIPSIDPDECIELLEKLTRLEV